MCRYWSRCVRHITTITRIFIWEIPIFPCAGNCCIDWTQSQIHPPFFSNDVLNKYEDLCSRRFVSSLVSSGSFYRYGFQTANYQGNLCLGTRPATSFQFIYSHGSNVSSSETFAEVIREIRFTHMEVSRSFHGKTWKFPPSVKVEASIACMSRIFHENIPWKLPRTATSCASKVKTN